MTAFYNEMDPYAAQWLENLIVAGHIAPGVVDRRPIQQIEAWELAGFTQCHFFAGIGVWSHALRRAGWSDDRPIWTGSCPCQPFSNAGQQKGFDDERHLWPVWFNLIRQCRPATVVGEQVACALDWLDLVSTDMEGAGYAFGASDLCAAGFGGAHIRQRLYFTGTFGLADRKQPGLEGHAGNGDDRNQPGRDDADPAGSVAARGGAGGLADTDEQGSGGRGICGPGESAGTSKGTTLERPSRFREDHTSNAPLLGRNPADWLYCRDGKWRPVEPGTFPLAHEAPARVGRLRAYGNALDAETATQFCGTVKEICDDLRPVREFDL